MMDRSVEAEIRKLQSGVNMTDITIPIYQLSMESCEGVLTLMGVFENVHFLKPFKIEQCNILVRCP